MWSTISSEVFIHFTYLMILTVFVRFLALADSSLAGTRPSFLRCAERSSPSSAFFLCVCFSLCLTGSFLWGWNVWVHLVCWVLCHFEFTHLISQLLRNQNRLHFGSVTPASAAPAAFRRREMDSIRVSVFQKGQFKFCQEYFVWLMSAFNTMGKLSSLASLWLLLSWKFYCWELIFFALLL